MLEGLPSRTIDKFPGVDQAGKAASRLGSILARNCEFLDDGQPITRRSLAAAFTQAGADPSSVFRYWFMPGWTRTVWLALTSPNPKFLQRDMIAGTQTDVITGLPGTTVGGTIAQSGSRLLFSTYDNRIRGNSPGYIWNGALNGVPLPIVDELWQNPMVEGVDFNFTILDSLVNGSVVAGDHKVGIVVQTRNGFVQPPIVANATFTAGGGKQVQLTLTPVGNWPDWVLDVSVIFTTVQNQDIFYFVPGDNGGTGSLPAGTSTPLVLTFDISDEALVLSQEATDWFDITTRNELDDPAIILPFGDRTVYVVDLFDSAAIGKVSTLLISEPGQPQYVTLSKHAINLPGRLAIRAAFVMHNVLYVLGPAWTFAYADPRTFPTSWPLPIEVDTAIGANAPHCVTKNPSGEFAWVASSRGLYAFNGSYTRQPSSNRITDWGRINWATASHHVSVADDPDTDTVYVLAPLDGATLPTHVLAFDYKAGIDWRKIRYSIWDFANLPNPGFIANIFNDVDNDLTEIWLNSAAASPNKFYRLKSEAAGDVNLRGNDDGSPVNSQWQSQNLPDVMDGPVTHVADILAVRGNGACSIVHESQDQTRSQNGADITLSQTPGRHYTRLINIQSESASVRITNKNTLNSWFLMERVKRYFNRFAEFR